eukprot:TRINITY_DN3245_c0_g1_i1.p1 TRINITY_DN3245_c0_g1~~TRINITY_DN3245_c0_g1_i1.p1  ORF type:complete len:1738 (+),score=496.49 TRINITY_DN3245_c0_g1_i1:83-5296(+)
MSKIWSCAVILLCVGTIFSHAFERSGVAISDPDVLLPSLGNVKYTIHGYNSCFRWQSTSLAVEVEVLPGTAGCSTSAILSSGSSALGRRTGTIIAEDEKSGRTLRCEVVVNDIVRLEVLTTRRTVHVGDFEVLQVQAFDAEGNVFSAVETLPFAWSVGPGVVQIVPFSDAPVSHQQHANHGTSSVLVRGVSTGYAQVSVALELEGYNVMPMSVPMAVVEPLALQPAVVVVVAPGAHLQYKLLRLRDSHGTVVDMPNDRYVWGSENQTVATVDNSGLAVAQNAGFSLIDVHDRTMVESGASATLAVGVPAAVSLTVVGDEGWVWCAGMNYTVEVAALDSAGRRIALSQGVELSLRVAGGECLTAALNTSWGAVSRNAMQTTLRYELFARCVGAANLEAKFAPSTRAQHGLWAPVYADHDVVIQPPVTVVPVALLMPDDADVDHTYALRAQGGSGLFDWRSDSANAPVSENGVVTGKSAGKSAVVVIDRLDPRNRATCTVEVVPVAALAIKGPLFVRVGAQLQLTVDAFDRSHGLFHNASMLPFVWSVSPNTTMDLSSSSGAVAVFHALQEGSADVTVVYHNIRTKVRVTVYPPLQATIGGAARAVVSLGSSAVVRTSGGPPLSDAREMQVEVDADAVRITPSGPRAYVATCLKHGEHVIQVKAGRGQDGAVVESVSVVLKCALPASVAVLGRVGNRTLPECEADGVKALYVHVNSQFTAVAEFKDDQDTVFHNASTIVVEWTIRDARVLATVSSNPVRHERTLKAAVIDRTVVSIRATGFDEQGLRRAQIAEAVFGGPLAASATVLVTEELSLHVSSVPIIVSTRASASATLLGGSGRGLFELNDTTVAALTDIKQGGATVTPRVPGTVAVSGLDVCTLAVAVSVVHVSQPVYVRVSAPGIELQHAQLSIVLEVEDGQGRKFSDEQLRSVDVAVHVDGCDSLTVRPTDAQALFSASSAKPCVAFVWASVAADGIYVRSADHRLQIVSPLSIAPSVLRLVPCASFQLDPEGVSAGVTVVFAVDDASVATVDSNGVVVAKNTGTTMVRAVAQVSDPSYGTLVHLSTASCEVRVAPLTGIRIATLSSIVAGAEVPVYVEGAAGEPPYAFDRPDVTYTWESSTVGVATISPPYRAARSGLVSMRASGLQPGRTALHARVSLPACGTLYPASQFEDRLSLHVGEPLRLTSHVGLQAMLLLAPLARSRITTNKDTQQRLRYTIHGNDTAGVTVDTDGLVKAGAHPATVFVTVEDEEGHHVVLKVAVRRVHGVSLLPDNDTPLLAVGGSMRVQVLLHDAMGLVFDSSDSVELSYLRSFADVVDLTAGPVNGTITLRAAQQGRCIVRVQVVGTPNAVDYLPVIVGDVITPSAPVVHLGGVINFTVSHGLPGSWLSGDEVVLQVDPVSGHSLAKTVGRASVIHNSTVRTHTPVTVVKIQYVSVGVPATGSLNTGLPHDQRVPVAFTNTLGGPLVACSDCNIKHNVKFECVIDSLWGRAHAVTDRFGDACLLSLRRPEFAALQGSDIDSVQLTVRASDQSSTYLVEQQARVPTIPPLVADTTFVTLEPGQLSRVSIYGRKITTESSSSSVLVRDVAPTANPAVFEVKVKQNAPAGTYAVNFRDGAGATASVVVTVVRPLVAQEDQQTQRQVVDDDDKDEDTPTSTVIPMPLVAVLIVAVVTAVLVGPRLFGAKKQTLIGSQLQRGQKSPADEGTPMRTPAAEVTTPFTSPMGRQSSAFRKMQTPTRMT